ncbi:MAG: hypothetical protein ACXW6T_17735 [Candidatus Binatia bacterium]
MSEEEKDDYVVLFRGAKLSRSQANRVGFTVICGFVTVIVLVPTIGDTLLTKLLVIGVTILGFSLFRRK